MYFPLSFCFRYYLTFQESFILFLSFKPGPFGNLPQYYLLASHNGLMVHRPQTIFCLDSYLGNGLELTLSLILCSCFMLLLLSLPFQSSLRAILILSKSNILTVGYILRAFLSMPTYLFICKSVFYTYHNSLLRPLNPGASCMFKY